MRNDQRDAALIEVQSRVVQACLTQSELRDGMALDVLINDTLYHEKKRLEIDRKSPRWQDDVAFWEGVKQRLGKAAQHEQRELLTKIVGRFTDEIRGNFSPWVYNVATRAMPKGLSLLLNAASPKRLVKRGLPGIGGSIRIHGEVEALRRCQEQGTVILAPTHVSNLDSPVVGWALFEMGLPPFTYGAGLNLFSNPVMSFFMRNLGAYRVDRLKKAPLYKDILKEYATVALEMGQPNLFFPAGTRMRSGKVEQHLKLGLLSTGVRAYINNLKSGKERPNIYIVPCNINYHLVLEAETLIHDHLRREGKSRYIITDDESSKATKVASFAQDVLNLDSRITVNVGPPLDPFGNDVDADGNSYDCHGRPVDITRYVMDRSGKPEHLPQRDRVFTQLAGETLKKRYLAYNMVMTTNLVAFALYEHIKNKHPELDRYRLLRVGDDGTGVTMRELVAEVKLCWNHLKELANTGGVHLDPDTVAGGDAARIVQDALRHFGSYHTSGVMQRSGDRVFAGDMNLLLYYGNKLRGYGLEAVMAQGASHE